MASDDVAWGKLKQEQPELLRSEIRPASPWLPMLVIHINAQIKTKQSQSYEFE